jgi:putative cell wall-binding protein
VVLASGQDFPDALAASALAGSVGGPILLAKVDELSAEAGAYLSTSTPTIVHVLGDENSISDALLGQVSSAVPGVTITRIVGDNRYQTMQEVAEYIEASGNPTVGIAGYDKVMFLADGTNFPDALAAGPQAFSGPHPIILTRPDTLRPEAEAAIDDIVNDPEDALVIILGGTLSVSQAVEDAINAKQIETLRVAGDNRYDTARDLATTLVSLGALDPVNIGLASGQNFPDALAAASYLGGAGAPLVLTRTDELPTETEEFLAAQALETEVLHVFGGTPTITEATVDAALAATTAEQITATISADPSQREVTVVFSEDVDPTDATTRQNCLFNNNLLSNLCFSLAFGSSIVDNQVELTATLTVSATPLHELEANDTIRIPADAIEAADGSGRFVQPVTFTVPTGTTGPVLSISAVDNAAGFTVFIDEIAEKLDDSTVSIQRLPGPAPTVINSAFEPPDSQGTEVAVLTDVLQAGDVITIVEGFVDDWSGHPSGEATSPSTQTPPRRYSTRRRSRSTRSARPLGSSRAPPVTARSRSAPSRTATPQASKATSGRCASPTTTARSP